MDNRGETMREKIIKFCQDIENEHNIRILFAVENGSRSWGMESENSDYDVRFVFIRPYQEYLKLTIKPDIIYKHYDQEGISCKQEGCYYDICGFDIYKYCRMLKQTNPTMIEWLKSDILYYGDKPIQLLNLINHNYKTAPLYHHYKSMCKNNYIKYIKGTPTTYKRYLYAMRGLINAKYVIEHEDIPPINFNEAISALQDTILPSIIEKLTLIIQLKKHGKEKDIIEHIPRLDEAIETFLKTDDELPQQTRIDIDQQLDKYIIKHLMKKLKAKDYIILDSPDGFDWHCKICGKQFHGVNKMGMNTHLKKHRGDLDEN